MICIMGVRTHWSWSADLLLTPYIKSTGKLFSLNPRTINETDPYKLILLAYLKFQGGGQVAYQFLLSSPLIVSAGFAYEKLSSK